MKHATAWATSLCLVAAPLLAKDKADMTDTHSEIIAAVQAMTTAFQDKDFDRVLDSYESEATVVFDPSAPVSDRNELKQAFARFAAVDPQFFYGGHQVFVGGDIAMHIAPWTMTGTLPDGQTMTDNGLSIAIFRKQPDGGWKMVIDNPYGADLLK